MNLDLTVGCVDDREYYYSRLRVFERPHAIMSFYCPLSGQYSISAFLLHTKAIPC
jgi:hypothetical protein